MITFLYLKAVFAAFFNIVFILIFFLFFFWLQYVIIKNKIIQRMNFEGIQHLERQYLKSSKFEYFSVQRMIDGELIPSIMSPEKLIDYINMDDCHQEEYEIFDCTSEFGAIKPLRYK